MQNGCCCACSYIILSNTICIQHTHGDTACKSCISYIILYICIYIHTECNVYVCMRAIDQTLIFCLPAFRQFTASLTYLAEKSFLTSASAPVWMLMKVPGTWWPGGTGSHLIFDDLIFAYLIYLCTLYAQTDISCRFCRSTESNKPMARDH